MTSSNTLAVVSKPCRCVDDTGSGKIMIVIVEVIRRMVVVVGGYSYLTQPMDPEKKSLNFILPTKYVIPKV